MSPSPDFRLLFESAPGLYLVLVPDLTIVAVSNAYLRATKTSRAEILGRGIFDVFPDNPDDPSAQGVANLRASLERVLALKRPDAMAVQKYDIRRPETEGGGFEVRYWSPINSPVLGEDGQLAYVIHRVEDVTEFVRLKEQHSEQHQVAEDLRTHAGRMEAEVYRRAREIQDANRELRALKADLELRVEARTTDLRRANDDLQQEIAERQRTAAALRTSEEQLRQAQKLEAIGRLAGGVAHDFNNLLTVILAHGELAKADLSPTEPVQADLSEITSAGQRAAELTRQLLAFSRQQVLELRVLDPNEILSNVHRMLQRVLGEDIELTMQLTPDVRKIRADRGRIEQVVMNLVVNARDAMPAGGKLTIQTANVDLDEVYAREHAEVAPGSYVVLVVSDTGTGMDKDTQARVFEPFFTTKERGKGTGLGLSTVFGIVKQSGGSIWLYSEPGAGTTFKIYLPSTDDADTGKPQGAAPPTKGGSETILLVEDDRSVRSVATTILRKRGYDVLEAPTPAEAVLLAERHPARIHLLLTDVVMPRMDGQELSERIAALRPGIKVVFMSGYTDDVILHHGILQPGFVLVEKPLTPDLLVRKVREALDAG